MNADPEPVLATHGLTRMFGARRAVDGLELRVPRGSIYGLLGRNGAGKSTTIRMILGLLRPTAGRVELFGRPLERDRLALLPRIGCLVEGPAFYPYLTGRQNLRWLGELTGGVGAERVQACLERVGLGDRGQDLYGGYSTGMRMRLGIAAALLHDPELVILDEPLNGLDPPAVLLVRNLILSLSREEGKTVIYSSHLLHEVELACDRVAVIEAGRLVAQESVATLLRPDATRVEVEVDDPAAATAAAGELPFVVRAAMTPAGRVAVELRGEEAAALNRALVERGLAVRALVPVRRTLEELFTELTGGAAS